MNYDTFFGIEKQKEDENAFFNIEDESDQESQDISTPQPILKQAILKKSQYMDQFEQVIKSDENNIYPLQESPQKDDEILIKSNEVMKYKNNYLQSPQQIQPNSTEEIKTYNQERTKQSKVTNNKQNKNKNKQKQQVIQQYIHNEQQQIKIQKSYNPNSITLPPTDIPNSDKKQKNKVMMFQFQYNNGTDFQDVTSVGNVQKQQQRRKNIDGTKLDSKKLSTRSNRLHRFMENSLTTSNSPQPKKITRQQNSLKKQFEELDILDCDNLKLNPNIQECKPNLYENYVPTKE